MVFEVPLQNIPDQTTQFTTPLSNRLSVRLYSDCRPCCMETSALQKGLVLMVDGKELIEEGMGFGVPVAKYFDKTYFSTTAEISAFQDGEGCVLRKRFVLDAVSKKIWNKRYIDDDFYSSFRKRFAKLYLNHKELSPLFNRLMELREYAKIKTEFVKVKSKGEITTTYQICPHSILVNVDFSALAVAGCEELLVLNEQGSTTFDTYSDSGGLKLVQHKIGGWGAVTARQAFLQSGARGVWFGLCRMDRVALVRGWERTRNRFSWTGLSYSLASNTEMFSYRLHFGC